MMQPPNLRLLTWALALLFGVLALGDQGFHALTACAHAEEAGPDDWEPQDETCPACGFFAESQILADPPAQPAAPSSVPPPVPNPLPPLDRSVGSAASSRGPPTRD